MGGRRLCVLAFGAVIVSLLSAGCSSKDDAVPRPKLARFLHVNYTLVSQRSVSLVPGQPAAEVVISRGPGSDPNRPVSGGTADVQVLTYDSGAARWVLGFDAANRASVGLDEEPGPLLDQAHPIEDAGAVAVRFRGADRPRLAVYGLDGFTNHPSYNVGVLSFVKGAATMEYDTQDDPDSLGLARPKLVGPSGKQQLDLAADLTTSQGGACCPVRTFHRRLSYSRSQGVYVSSDDRPYLGVVVAPVEGRTGAKVIRVDANSPATGVFQPGDTITGLVDAPALKPSSNSTEDPLVDEFEKEKAGATVSLTVERQSQQSTRSMRLASVLDSAHLQDLPANGSLGVTVDDSMTITDGTELSPLLGLGVEAGDRLIDVNGWSLSNPSDLSSALLANGGQEVPVTYADLQGVSHTVSVQALAVSAGDPDLQSATQVTPDYL